MPHLTVPEDTFRRLAARAAAFNISVDDLVQPALDRLAETGTSLSACSASSPTSRRSSSSGKCWSEPNTCHGRMSYDARAASSRTVGHRRFPARLKAA